VLSRPPHALCRDDDDAAGKLLGVRGHVGAVLRHALLDRM
jgi:hypothetical protein